MKSHLIIRADVGPTVGVGHVMRTSALATAWQKLGGKVTFVCPPYLPASLAERLQRLDIQVETVDADFPAQDAMETVAIAKQKDANWVVLDGYRFDEAYQENLKSSGLKLLVMDDYCHANHRHADLVVNQNIYAGNFEYANVETDKLLLGPDYVLLRNEFQSIGQKDRRPPRIAKQLLITMGGADHENMTQTALQSLAAIPDAKNMLIHVVIGACNPDYDDIKSIVKNLELNVVIHRNLDRMSPLLEQCDLAITAGGSTCYELAKCGVPAVIISTADNQIELAKSFDVAGAMHWIGHFDSLLPDQLTGVVKNLIRRWQTRTNMIEAGRKIVDGQGANRIARRVFSSQFQFRDAVATDAEQLLAWRNDPAVRIASFNSHEVQLAEHQAWLTRLLESSDRDLWIIELDDQTAIGQVRMEIDVSLDEATISISLDAQCRGKGWGTMIIESACQKVFATEDVDEIVAIIKPSNGPSIAAFEKAGFVRRDEAPAIGTVAQRYTLSRQKESTIESKPRMKKSA